MKLNKSSVLTFSLAAFFACNTASADLSSQLAAVAAAEKEALALERAEQRAKAKAAEAAAAAKKAEKERAYNEYLSDKKRDQSYEDELRQLELEERRLELQRRKARVNRENDFIEQELKREAARTDMIQSDADATRTLSKGAETWMIKDGEARVKKESGFFK